MLTNKINVQANNNKFSKKNKSYDSQERSWRNPSRWAKEEQAKLRSVRWFLLTVKTQGNEGKNIYMYMYI